MLSLGQARENLYVSENKRGNVITIIMSTYQDRQNCKKYFNAAVGDDLSKISAADLGRIILWALKKSGFSIISLNSFLHIVIDRDRTINDYSDEVSFLIEG